MRLNLLFFVFLAFLCLGACAPLQVADHIHLSSGEFAAVSLNEENSNFRSNQRRCVYYYKPFPMDNNEHVSRWLNHYSRGEGRTTMKTILERSSRYFPLMRAIFKDGDGLPVDLIHIVMLESGFNPYAKSDKGATGQWQFVEETAGDYELKINDYIDERRDPVLATGAAESYLHDLYCEFRDWRLSMTAYHSGPGTVRNAIRKYDSRNFWYLLENGAFQDMPRTKKYVPIIIAMRKIALRPRVYGFYDLNYQDPIDYELVSLRGSASFSDISKQLNVPNEELRRLNPKFKTDHIPAERGGTRFRVPAHIRI